MLVSTSVKRLNLSSLHTHTHTSPSAAFNRQQQQQQQAETGIDQQRPVSLWLIISARMGEVGDAQMLLQRMRRWEVRCWCCKWRWWLLLQPAANQWRLRWDFVALVHLAFVSSSYTVSRSHSINSITVKINKYNPPILWLRTWIRIAHTLVFIFYYGVHKLLLYLNLSIETEHAHQTFLVLSKFTLQSVM